MSVLLTKVIITKKNYKPLLNFYFLPGVKISSYSRKLAEGNIKNGSEVMVNKSYGSGAMNQKFFGNVLYI